MCLSSSSAKISMRRSPFADLMQQVIMGTLPEESIKVRAGFRMKYPSDIFQSKGCPSVHRSNHICLQLIYQISFLLHAGVNEMVCPLTVTPLPASEGKGQQTKRRSWRTQHHKDGKKYRNACRHVPWSPTSKQMHQDKQSHVQWKNSNPWVSGKWGRALFQEAIAKF